MLRPGGDDPERAVSYSYIFETSNLKLFSKTWALTVGIDRVHLRHMKINGGN
jgi:hypothetical protein